MFISVCFPFLFSISDMVTENGPLGEPLVLTSERYDLYYPLWTDALAFEDSWILFLSTADRSGIDVTRWRGDGTFETLGRLGPREGISYIHTFAVNTQGLLVFKDLGTPRILSLDLQGREQGFERFGSATVWGSMIFWRDDVLLGTTQKLLIEAVVGEQPPVIATVNRMLPEVTHPSQGNENLLRMLLARSGNVLAVGYTLHNKVMFFDLAGSEPRMRALPIRFRGYREAPDNYPDVRDPNSKVFQGYYSSFHRLIGLHWFHRECYGFFQRGYDSYGLWVNVLRPEQGFRWDNDTQAKKIIALSDGEVLVGEVEETTDEGMTWRLWRESSLP